MGRTVVWLRRHSGVHSMGVEWRSRVRYDSYGTPYARTPEGGMVRLERNGETADHAETGGRWLHRSGSAVAFPEAVA